MASDDSPVPQPPVTVTLQIPAERRAELSQLPQDFASGRVHAIAPAFGREIHEYLANGGPELEKLVETWRMLDVKCLKHLAQEFADLEGLGGPQSKAAAELVGYIENHR
jgi:hypothetical protein